MLRPVRGFFSPCSRTAIPQLMHAIQDEERWPENDRDEAAWKSWFLQAQRSTLEEDEGGRPYLNPIPPSEWERACKERMATFRGKWHMGADLEQIKREGGDFREKVIGQNLTRELCKMAKSQTKNGEMASVHGAYNPDSVDGLSQVSYVLTQEEWDDMDEDAQQYYKLATPSEKKTLAAVAARLRAEFDIPEDREFSSMSLGMNGLGSTHQLTHGDNGGFPTLAILVMCTPQGGYSTEFVRPKSLQAKWYGSYPKVREHKWKRAHEWPEGKCPMMSKWMRCGGAVAFDATSPHRGSPLLPPPAELGMKGNPKSRVILYLGLQWKDGELSESAPIFAHQPAVEGENARLAFKECDGKFVYQVKCIAPRTGKKRKQA